MAARSIWKGTIRFNGTRLPVKLYSAVQDQGIHFHLLHDQDMVRLRQRMVNPETGKEVPFAEAEKGFEVERGRFVLLSRDELAGLEPEESRDITISRFVDPSAVNHQWYVRPYWLGPDGSGEDYAAFARALEEEEKEGIARWVMRKKEYLGALRAVEGRLALITLREADEVILASELEPPAGRAPDPKELDLARQLVSALEEEFDPEDYRDEFRARLMELIEAKRKGKTIEVEEYEPEPQPESLEEALRASLARR